MGLLSLLSVAILSVYIIFPEKVRYFYFKRCRKLCQGLFFHFAKIIIFSENLSFFCCFFSFFSLPWFSHSLPRLLHSLPRLSHSLSCLSHSVPWLSHSLPLRNLRENIIKKYRIPIEKAFTFWAFLSQRVHRFTPFVTFWWIPVKGGFTPWIPSVYRASGADVKGEPSFLAFARICEKK